MTYKQTLDWLFSQLPVFQRIGKAAYKANLDNTYALMEVLGSPHKSFKSVHIAGTNGKGSTAHLLASIYQEAGYKTVYLRIQRPDSIILSGPEAVVFPVDETKLVCSAKREVEYLNKDLDMCIYWNNDGSLIPGKYNVYLYLEGYQIGQSSFLLK